MEIKDWPWWLPTLSQMLISASLTVVAWILYFLHVDILIVLQVSAISVGLLVSEVLKRTVWKRPE